MLSWAYNTMILKRTANAGILLALDSVSILFDGVSREGTAYPATSDYMQDALIKERPDAICFTHIHPDHYDPDFVKRYKREVDGPVIAPDEGGAHEILQIGSVKITPVSSRHIGRVGIDVPHISYIVEGSSCVWFMGDAAVLQWKNRSDLPKPDVLIVPFAYATTETSWEITKSLGAKYVVIVHMPERDKDPYQLWHSVTTTINDEDEIKLWIPDIGETKEIV